MHIIYWDSFHFYQTGAGGEEALTEKAVAGIKDPIVCILSLHHLSFRLLKMFTNPNPPYFLSSLISNDMPYYFVFFADTHY